MCGPCTASIILGIEEASFLLKLLAFSRAPVIFLHAVNMLLVELVDKAHVCVKHHLEGLFAHLNINSLPVIFACIAIDVTVWTPTVSDKGMEVVIVEYS